MQRDIHSTQALACSICVCVADNRCEIPREMTANCAFMHQTAAKRYWNKTIQKSEHKSMYVDCRQIQRMLISSIRLVRPPGYKYAISTSKYSYITQLNFSL